jgi:hypothetical protein
MRCLGWTWGLCFLLLLCFVGRARADEIRVCVRPPNLPANVSRWAYTTGTGKLMTSDPEVFAMMTHGHTVYVFDPQAPQENSRFFPLPHNKLPCPVWVLQPKPPAPPTPVAPKNDDAPEDDKRDAPDPLPKPIAPPPEEEAHRPRPSPQCRLPGEVLPRRTVLPTETVLPTRTPTLPTKGPGSPITSAGPGKGDGSGTKKGVEKSPAEKAAEQLALAGAIANLQMNEDLNDPNGKPFGIPGGLNPYGPNHPATQAMAGVVLLVTGVLSVTGFEQKLRQAIQLGKPLVIDGVGKVSEEVAEQLAKKWGYQITHALAENGTIAEYAVMKKFTQNMGGRWQAHHLVERSMVKEFGLGNAEQVPAVILTEAEHKAIRAKLRVATKDVKDAQKLWQAYQRVYKKHPHWLKAIESYFVKCK